MCVCARGCVRGVRVGVCVCTSVRVCVCAFVSVYICVHFCVSVRVCVLRTQGVCDVVARVFACLL